MRPVWKGSISFGLVNIPVNMYSASAEKELSFILLHKKDHSEIRYARICKTEQKEVPWSEIVKAYEVSKGDYVVMDEKDFDKAHLKRTKSIEIVSFIHREEIDPIYFVKPYFLEPAKNADKAYSLLREALFKSKKVGLAKYVIRNREHLGVIEVHDNVLLLIELRYQSELRTEKELKVPARGKINEKEVGIAIKLIDHLTTKFNPKAFKDTYSQELKRIIKQKSKRRPVHPKAEKKPASPKIYDIMSLLQDSLDKKKKPVKKARKVA